jgi:flavodoxin long chain
MKKIGLFYWPKGGNVEKAAKAIKARFNEDEIDMIDLGQLTADKLTQYENLIFGCSTVGADHWEDATQDNKWYIMFHDLEEKGVDFGGKKTALFGLGDQINYPHNFQDGMERIYNFIKKHNVQFVGQWKDDGSYDFQESEALHDGYFRGLALDLDHQEDLLDERVDKWVAQLKKEF